MTSHSEKGFANGSKAVGAIGSIDSLADHDLQELLDAVPDAMIVVDRDGRIRLANRQAEQLFAYERKELTGRPVEVLVPEKLAGGHSAHRRSYFDQPAVRPMGEPLDLLARRRDGTEFPVEISLSPVASDQGMLAVASVRDVTERRRIAAEQRWQADFSRGIVNSLPGIFYLVDKTGRMRQWNANLESLTGYSAEELDAMTVWDFFEPAEHPKADEAMRAVFEDGKALLKAPLLLKDGTTRDYHFQGRRITLGGEEFLTGLGIDMTDVYRTEAALDYLSGLQRTLVDASKRFIALDAADLDDVITEVLGRVGSYCSVDRSYLFCFRQGRSLMDNTHEWCAPGIKPEIENLQGLPREAVPRVVEMMERREVMHVPRVADLPPEWDSDRVVFEEEDIQSLVVVPIVVSGELHGFVGFDSVRRERSWGEEEIRLLEVLADLFGAVIQRERTARALRDSETLRTHAERLGHLGSWEWDFEQDAFLPSEEWRRVTGLRAERISLEEALALAHPEEIEDIRRQVRLTRDTGVPYDLEHRIIRPDDGRVRWIKVHAEIEGTPENARRMVGFIQDITERKRIEAAIAESEAQYRSVVDNIREVVFQADAEGRWTFLNPAWEEITGYPVAESMAQRYIEFVHPRDRKGSEREFRELMAGRQSAARSEVRYLTQRGDFRWFEVNVRATSDADGRIVGCAGTLRDITQQREAEQKMRQLAHYDPVTGLPNRILALDRLDQLLKAADRKGEYVAVLFLDLDHFKKANDTLGHGAGDQLLKEAAQRLLADVREQDTVARFGGDEFLIMAGGLDRPTAAQPVAEKLLKSFRDSFHIQGREFVLTASLGIAIAPDDGTTSQDLLRNADIAMYQSKGEGRNTFHYFTQAMNRDVERRQSVEEQLRGALSRDELSLVFQPIVDLRNARVVGAEALLRWHNPTLGPVTPDEFIPIAEQTGLIDAMGQYVLERALEQAARWRIDRDPEFWVSVNVSPQQFRDPGLVGIVDRALSSRDLPGQALQVEVTESVLLDERGQAASTLAEFKARGIDVAMDDFGTGYASLSYLRHFPFDTLKIDRSFVGDITEDPKDAELVIASLSLARSLKLKVLAEGVETEAQLALLREHGCDLAQGYLFARPLPAADFDEFPERSLR
ncbi:bifunctional diguanylate cyclase/phosphodiesterase [Wenzhouxiangella sediminis]|uniref:cyclic-guanylate-specific phosphodiesterase n=1 Tax=Wenzhouxiangella sediminis TaxID=1792836 RepID=A0A3E1KB37_9GAMM|nr:EAL domain-containing protein [Wenzhouxiangella sediminis]RFF31725.1 EAL domain-containing protein [Wenzhouxiangella sediminis]